MQNIESRIQDLKEAAGKLSIKIEVANLNDQEFAIQSGYCKLNGEDLIILDKNLPDEEHLLVILNTLKKFNLDNIYVADWIREKIYTDKTAGAQS
jgi:nicotinate-nucleotide pyrophosphorylase